MKNKFMKKSMIISLAGGLLAASAATASAIVLSHRNNALNEDLNKSVYKKVKFVAGTGSGITFKGATEARVKPGKTFYSVDKPLAILEGYEFKYWTETDWKPGDTKPTQIDPNKVISADLTVYPYMEPNEVKNIDIIGHNTATLDGGDIYFEAHINGSTTLSTDVTWLIKDDLESSEFGSSCEYANISVVTEEGENKGKLKLTPKQGSTGKELAESGSTLTLKATSTTTTTVSQTYEIKLYYGAVEEITIKQAGVETRTINVKVGEEITDVTATVTGGYEKVNWYIIDKTQGTTQQGAASVVPNGNTGCKITGQAVGDLELCAVSSDGSQTKVATLKVNQADPATVTVYGPSRIDKNQTNPTYTAVVKDADGHTEYVNKNCYWWASTSKTGAYAESPVLRIGTQGEASQGATASAEETGVAYVYATTSCTGKGTEDDPYLPAGKASDRIAVNVSDFLSTVYSYVDSNNKTWIYSSSTIESNDLPIVRYCLDGSEAAKTIARADFNETIVIGDGITEIGDNFLYGCSSFDQTLSIPNSVTTIGDDFMFGCTSFNSTLSLGTGLTSIGEAFLEGATSFAQAITIPVTVTTIGAEFMYNCDSLTALTINCAADAFVDQDERTLANIDSSSAQASTGVTITCSDFTALHNRLPDSEASATNHRKLIQAA